MKISAKVKSIIFGGLALLLVLEAFDLFGGYDYLKSLSFSPTKEMTTIISSLKLTERGERTLRATTPTLDSRDVFNEKCNSHKAEVYVLGCYLTGDDSIHLYAIDKKELAGMNESTAAHELLHAVYHRLPFWEKSKVNEELSAAYENLNDEELKAAMDLYDDEDFYDELHSRLGTEIKDLPENLEKHYAKIFSDRKKVVAFYDNYSGTFKKLKDDLKTTEEKLNNLKVKIEDEEGRLKKVTTDLNERIDDYNRRVSEKKYSTIAEIKNEGKNLQAEVDKINSDYLSKSKIIQQKNVNLML